MSVRASHPPRGARPSSPAGKVVRKTNVGTGSSGLSEAHVAGSADRPKGAVRTVPALATSEYIGASAPMMPGADAPGYPIVVVSGRSSCCG